jgi:hypothetical protein
MIYMQRKILLFIYLLCVFTGCNHNKKQTTRYSEEQINSLELDSTAILTTELDSLTVIDLNPFLKNQSFDFGSLVKTVKLIPLETTDESLLDEISKILVTDSNIYIKDDLKGGGIVIFDREGKFIKRISNGQGPGELLRLYDIAFDAANNELVAYQHSFLLFFTPSGEYIRQERLPFGFYNFTVIPGGYLFKALDRQGNEHLGALEKYTLFVTDKSFKLKSVGIYFLPLGSVLGGLNYIYQNNNAIKITQEYTDTVYQYVSETNRLMARYVLSYNKKIPERYLHGSFEEFENAARQNDCVFYIGEYAETETHHVFNFQSWYLNLQIVVFRDKRSGNMQGGTISNFIIGETPPITGCPESSSGNYFIKYYYPSINDTILSYSSIISEEDKAKIKNLTEDDNPVLVFYELNNF